MLQVYWRTIKYQVYFDRTWTEPIFAIWTWQIDIIWISNDECGHFVFGWSQYW